MKTSLAPRRSMPSHDGKGKGPALIKCFKPSALKTRDRMTRRHRMGFKKTFSPHETIRRGMMAAGGFNTNLLDACQSVPSCDERGRSEV